MTQPKQALELILASTSRYRREMLKRLGLPFSCENPGVDETGLPGEHPQALAERLAASKAHAIAGRFPAAVVIGADQVAACGGLIVGKPGDESRATEQLLHFSGRVVRFFSAISVVCLQSGFRQTECVTTDVHFRELDEGTIHRYLALDQPFDCAGSFRSEAAGPMLLESMASSDPTAIIGLPLIALSGMLRSAGFRLP